MIIKTAQQSLLDLLMRMMPELQDGKGGPMVFMVRKPTVNKKAVKALMSIWKDDENTISYRKFKRPDDISRAELDLLVTEKLIHEVGNELEVTAKGVEIIKTTILGDERSSWEDDGKSMDYEVALANTKPKRKMVKGAKRASKEDSVGGNWYKKYAQVTPGETLGQTMNMLVSWATQNIGQVSHIVAYAKAALKEAPPQDSQQMQMYEIAKKIASSRSLDELRMLAKEAQRVV
jgi:hypothetical protein